MTTHTELTVRRSNVEPSKYVICVKSTGTALEHPAKRLEASLFKREHDKSSYFDDPTQALLAIDDWKDLAAELPRKRVPFQGLTVAKCTTLAEEIDALRKQQAKRDANPFYGWHPCSGTHCLCNPAPVAFRSPSPELLAFQAGKPAYGRK